MQTTLVMENNFLSKRRRIRHSDVSVAKLEQVLAFWLNAVGANLLDTLLQEYTLNAWAGKGTPLPADLCGDVPFLFTKFMSEEDATVHPQHKRLAYAILAGIPKHVKFSSTKVPLPLQALFASRTMLKIMGKYRDLKHYDEKLLATMKKASIDSKNGRQQHYPVTTHKTQTTRSS